MTDADLDRAVAEAMGWTIAPCKDGSILDVTDEHGEYVGDFYEGCWKPSTDDACAFRALRWLVEHLDEVKICRDTDGKVRGVSLWCCDWGPGNDGEPRELHDGILPTLNLAICEAVIAESKRNG